MPSFAPPRETWAALAAVKRAFQESVLADDPDAAYSLAQLARARMLEIDPSWPHEPERRADLETHLAVAAKLAKLGPRFRR
ncbi:MAG: hypothetical protein IT374_01025 [Polyangiaceae bacterium]|nr:hypothetical protein [Polyangiaceae bacterium]